MPRQTITITDPNHQWLQARVDSGEFNTTTEAVNDALRRVREMESSVEELRSKLIRAEERGLTEKSPEQIRARARAELELSNDI